MGHLLHLMFRSDGDVMESDVFVWVFGGSKRGLSSNVYHICDMHIYQASIVVHPVQAYSVVKKIAFWSSKSLLPVIMTNFLG